MLTNKGIPFDARFRTAENVESVTTLPAASRTRSRRPRRGFFGIVLLLFVGAGVWLWMRGHQTTEGQGGHSTGNQAQPVIPGVVQQKEVPIFPDGLGTVQALNTVTIRPRVDGQIEKIAFTEGEDVKAGDLLVQIDPAPFQAQLAQTEAKQRQDEAQLANARADLARYADLIAKKVISSQQYDSQRALVDQLAAAVKSDQAAVENTRVQLGYATIVSPIDGRTGIRLVDEGNLVRANDTNGIVVITQLQPISLVFTLPEQNLGQVHQRTGKAGDLQVLALDRDNKTVLDEGKLTVIDNQIDTSTGTIRIKATFPNRDFQLWPGQFVNARLLVETRPNGIVVPASVIQRGPQGPYAFVIKDDLTVEQRPVKVDRIEQGEALIDEGLHPGERIVVDGQYRLQPGSKITLPDPNAKAGGPQGGGHRPAH